MINTERRIMDAILVHVDEHKEIRFRLAASRDTRRSLIPVGFRDAVEPDAHFIASGARRGSSPTSGGNGRIVSRTSVNARGFAVGKQCAILYQIGSSVDVHVSGRPRIPENRAVTQHHDEVVWWKLAAVVSIFSEANLQLLQVVETGGGLSGGLGFGQRRQKESRENSDNGDDNKQLNQSERILSEAAQSFTIVRYARFH